MCLYYCIMGSANPNRFLPSQFFQAAKRHVRQSHCAEVGNNKKTDKLSENIVPPSHVRVDMSKLSDRPTNLAKLEDTPSTSTYHRSSSSSKTDKDSSRFQSYFPKVQKTNKFDAYSNKYLLTSSQRHKKPYFIPRNSIPPQHASTNCSSLRNTSDVKDFSHKSMQWNSPDAQTTTRNLAINTNSNPTAVSQMQSNDATSNTFHSNRTTFSERKTKNVQTHEHAYKGASELTKAESSVSTRSTTVKAETRSRSSKETSSSSQDPNEKLHRNWIESTEFDRKCKIVTSCSIASYNILSQTLLEANDYLYRGCKPHVLTWRFRWKNLKKELTRMRMDVLCLQEVEECHYSESLEPWLKSKGYSCSYKRRTGHDALKPDGVLIACSSRKFQIVDTIPVEYYRPSDHLTKWHNVGLILVLKVNERGRRESPYICVGNTHLVYNPKRGDVKLVQLSTFLSEIDRVLKKYMDQLGYRLPLIVCGDFNSTPFSPLFDFITRGNLNYRDLSSKYVSGQKVWNGGRILPDYLLPPDLKINDDCTFVEDDDETNKQRRKHVLSHGLGSLSSSGHQHIMQEATTMQDGGITVDYIFYSDSRKSESAGNDPKSAPDPARKYSLQLKKRLSPCTSSDVHRAHGIPNTVHPSDHLPVSASFAIVAEK